MHTCAHAHHMHMRTCAHAHMRTCAHAHMHTCTHAHICAHMRMRTYAHMHMYMHMLVYTHTHIQAAMDVGRAVELPVERLDLARANFDEVQAKRRREKMAVSK